MPFAQSAGARIHWDAAGEGTPVLLIMGHLYSGRMWYPLLPALTKAHRAIWFDNRGTGESDTTAQTSIAQMAGDALAVLDAAGVERAHVYGISLGGVIVAEFAMTHPERVASLVLAGTMMRTPEKPNPLGFTKLFYKLPRPLVKALIRLGMTAGSYGSAVTRPAMATDARAYDADRFTMKGVAAQAAALMTYRTTREAVAAIAAPTLVLHGAQDRIVAPEHARELAQVIPGAQMTVFEGAGHNFVVAATKASDAAVLDFFAAVEARAAPAA
ncbi:MAG TPA: alpha/beta fold hydrolase [Caulobacteraceae bacterium]|jgi:pimeloyl-ACP methyl ester carboxylesterase|nr:alpha/beta fold hydrolase [Caulobacteraceae bacterium]